LRERRFVNAVEGVSLSGRLHDYPHNSAAACGNGDDRAGHVVACHYTDQAERFRMLAAAPETWAQKPFAI
jgi:hypothetical protein